MVATAHDVLATIAFIALLDLEVSLVVVAGVLTVLGYSLNDTIVIFDRVRENLRQHRRRSLAQILNLSINAGSALDRATVAPRRGAAGSRPTSRR